MFIFYFLGVGPPCRSILYQFWLCEEAQCVYLRCHLGSILLILTHHFTVFFKTKPFSCSHPKEVHDPGHTGAAFLCFPFVFSFAI